MSKRKRLLGVFVLALLAAVAAVFGTGFAARAASSGETELTPSLSVGQISVSGNALIVDFGIKTASNAGMLDRDSGWYADPTLAYAKEQYIVLNQYADYLRQGVKIESDRFLIDDGRFGIDLDQGNPGIGSPVSGDVLRLKNGFPLLKLGTLHFSGYPQEGENYLTLTEDMIFCYDGTAWTRAVPATSAFFTNTQEEKESLCVGTTLPLTWQTNEGAVEPVPAFTSSAPEIATVSAAGVVTGISEGTATITAQFLNVTATVELSVSKAPEKNGILAAVTNGSVRGGKTYLIAYKGETLNAAETAKKLTAKFTFDNGTEGADFTVTADMISFGKFDSSAVGETSVMLTSEGLSVEVPVWVYDVAEIAAPAPVRVTDWNGSGAINLLFEALPQGEVDVQTVNIISNPRFGIPSDMAVLREPLHGASSKEYAFHSMGQVNGQQALLYFNNYSKDALRVGMVLTLNDNYRY